MQGRSIGPIWKASGTERFPGARWARVGSVVRGRVPIAGSAGGGGGRRVGQARRSSGRCWRCCYSAPTRSCRATASSTSCGANARRRRRPSSSSATSGRCARGSVTASHPRVREVSGRPLRRHSSCARPRSWAHRCSSGPIAEDAVRGKRAPRPPRRTEGEPGRHGVVAVPGDDYGGIDARGVERVALREGALRGGDDHPA